MVLRAASVCGRAGMAVGAAVKAETAVARTGPAVPLAEAVAEGQRAGAEGALCSFAEDESTDEAEWVAARVAGGVWGHLLEKACRDPP